MSAPHKLLVIGVGSIGERHLRCFLSTGRVEAAFVEVNPALRETIRDRYPVAGAFDSLEAGLGWRPTLAVVATPAPLHVGQSTTLLNAGVHTLIEKPLSTTTEGVDALLEAADRPGLVSGVAYVYRCHPLLTAMREALHSGRFGKPVELVAVSGQHFPLYRPAYRTIYYSSHAHGGGAIQDALTHVLNAGEWLVGPIDRLVADAAHQVLEGVDVEDTVHVLARHGNVMATYSLNQHQAPNESTFTVVCERGTVRCEFHQHRWRWMTEASGEWHDETIAPLERDTVFIAQAEMFLDAIEGRSPVHCPLSEGLQTLRVNLAALASLREQRWKSIEP